MNKAYYVDEDGYMRPVDSNEAGEDVVNHPKHYQMAGGLEVIDFIVGATEGLDGKDGYFVGNILKYVCRYSKKNGLEDLKKAQWYLNKLIESKE